MAPQERWSDDDMRGEPGPTPADAFGSRRADERGPLRADERGPIRADERGSMQTDQRGPIRVDELAPMRADERGPMRADESGPMRADRPGPVRASGPVPAPATPLSRLRERLALRRVLGRRNDRAFDDSVLVFSGRGAPLDSARTRVRSEREATRLRSAASDSGTPLTNGALPDQAGEPVFAGAPSRADSPLRAGAPRHTVPPLSDRVTGLRERIDARRRITATLAGAGAVSRQVRGARADGHAEHAQGYGRGPAGSHDRRPLMAFGGVAALLLLVGVLAGRSVAPLPAAQQQSAAAPAAVAAPSSTAKSPVQASPSAKAQEAQVSTAVVVGTGGAGYTVADIRYGIHPGDFRIVLDMTAAASAHGIPQATVGVMTDKKIRLQIAGVSASQHLGQLPGTNPVSAVALLQPSPVAGAAVYEFTLSRAVTPSAYWAAGPLRLVIDLH